MFTNFIKTVNLQERTCKPIC